jgi:hypothetical protein
MAVQIFQYAIYADDINKPIIIGAIIGFVIFGHKTIKNVKL